MFTPIVLFCVFIADAVYADECSDALGYQPYRRQPAFEDTFNDDDMENWTVEIECNQYNLEKQCYTPLPENLDIVSGKIHITPQVEEDYYMGVSADDGCTALNPENCMVPTRFTSARIRSNSAWLHGRFQICAKLPKGSGLWPAITFLPASMLAVGDDHAPWPEEGEIVVVEARGDEVDTLLGALIWGDAEEHIGFWESAHTNATIPDWTSEFHLFELVWTHGAITWLVDGKQWAHRDLDTGHFHPHYPIDNNARPFDAPLFANFNVAVGGTLFGDSYLSLGDLLVVADTWTMPTLQIDSFRYWREGDDIWVTDTTTTTSLPSSSSFVFQNNTVNTTTGIRITYA